VEGARGISSAVLSTRTVWVGVQGGDSFWEVVFQADSGRRPASIPDSIGSFGEHANNRKRQSASLEDPRQFTTAEPRARTPTERRGENGTPNIPPPPDSPPASLLRPQEVGRTVENAPDALQGRVQASDPKFNAPPGAARLVPADVKTTARHRTWARVSGQRGRPSALQNAETRPRREVSIDSSRCVQYRSDPQPFHRPLVAERSTAFVPRIRNAAGPHRHDQVSVSFRAAWSRRRPPPKTAV